jgi:hypothetical protein
MSECQAKLVWHWLSEEEETERSEVTEKPVSASFSFAEKVKVRAGHRVLSGSYVRAVVFILSRKYKIIVHDLQHIVVTEIGLLIGMYHRSIIGVLEEYYIT